MNRFIKRIAASILLVLMICGVGTEPLTAFAKTAVIRYQNGDTFTGNVSKARKKNGKGTYTCSDGTVITGIWKNNLLQGKGKIVYPDGERYVGNFKKGKKSGKGKYYFRSGDTYNGSWLNDKMNGSGKYTWKNKWTLTGRWKKGKINGTCTFRTSKYVYKLSARNGTLKKVISRRKR